jgi:hypothetical protein
MKNIIYFLLIFSSSSFAVERINFLTPFGEIVSSKKTQSVINLMENKDQLIIDVVPDYQFNKLYVTAGKIEGESLVYVIDAAKQKVTSMIPGMFSVNVPVIDSAPYFITSQIGAEFYSNAPNVEIRTRLSPQKIVAKNKNLLNESMQRSIQVLVKDCFDVKSNKFYESWKEKASLGIDLRVDNSPYISFDQIGGCWPDGTRWNLDHDKSKTWKLGLSTWATDKWSTWSSELRFYPMRSMGTNEKTLIPDLESDQLNRTPTIKMFDFGLEQAKTITAKSELAKSENVLFFAGLSRDRQNAYYVAGHYEIRERKRFSDQLFRLSKQHGIWVLEQVDVSAAIALYEKDKKRKLNIQWVIERH